ncbi:MAG: DUF3971 domain-containing protein, partial [Amphiplicatus sp.]
LQSGPVSLALFTRSAEFAVERALPPDHRVHLEEASLARGERRGEYVVSMNRLRIEGPDDERIGDLSNITLTFSVDDLVHGQFGPRTIRAVDPTLRIVRGDDKRFTLDYAENRTTPTEANAFELLTGGPFFRGAFESAELVGAKVFFHDVASARSWRADAAVARIVRHKDGYAARVEGVFDIEGKPASLRMDATYLETTGLITADVKVNEAPVGDILEMFFGERAGVFAAPVTGSASIMLTRSGEVISSRLEGRAGQGTLTIGGHTAPVDHIDVIANFDPKLSRFDVERFVFDIHGSTGAVSGGVHINFADGGLAPASIDMALLGRDISLDTHGLLPETLAVPRLETKASYDFASRRLALTDLSTDIASATLAGDFSYASARDPATGAPVSPEMTARLAIEGAFDPATLLAIWPEGLGEGARDFVATRLPRARVSNVAFSLDLPSGAKQPGGPMPDDALRLTFDIADATAIYAETMTPLTRASGAAVLTGNRFVVSDMRGQVGDIAISGGEIDFTALSPRGQPVYYRFAATGGARSMLEVLNQPPLLVLQSADLEPQRFISGSGTARVEIMRPNRREVPRESYEYKGTATFKDLAIAEFYRGSDLAKAAGKIDLATNQMTIDADAELGGAPVNIEWRQRLDVQTNRSQFKVSGVVDSSTGDVFGIPTRQFLRGPVAFSADAKGDLGALSALSLSADFSRAALNIDSIAWDKPEGSPASGELDVVFGAEGFDVRKIALTGEGVDLSGSAQFDPAGLIKGAAFDKVKFDGGADVTVTLSRSLLGSVDVALTGAYLNAGPTVQSFVEAGDAPGRERNASQMAMSLRARIDALELRGGALFRDVAFDFARTPERVQAMSLSALTDGGSPLSVVLKETGAEKGPRQSVEARTDDIGQLLAALFGVASIQKGEGSMELFLDAGETGGLTGTLAARNMRLVGAPLLARIFAAGSLNGLVGLLNGSGIELSQAVADFEFREGVLTLRDARASGPSVGITAAGVIAAGQSGAVDLRGAVAPAYQVKSFLGKAPLIGDIFVNREGEGVVALAYDVHGTSDAPLVSVNPLSALTPGFLRRIFEGERTAPAVDPAPQGEPAQPEQ